MEAPGSTVSVRVGRVADTHSGVDRDEGVAAERDLVGELGDGDGGAIRRVERRDLFGQVAAGVGPRGPLAVVDPEAVLVEEAVGSVLHDERPAQAGDHAVVVARPPDGGRGAVRAGERVRVDVEAAAGTGGGGPGPWCWCCWVRLPVRRLPIAVPVVDTAASGRIATATTTAMPAVRDVSRLNVGPDVARRQPS